MTAPARYRRRPAAKRKARHEGGLLAAAGLALVLAVTAVRYASQHPGVTVLAAALLLLVAAIVGWAKARRRRHARTRVHTMDDILRLDHVGFEYFTASLMRRDGCRKVERVGGAGDLAADNLGYLPDGRRFLLQAKFYALGTKVGSEDVQQVGGTFDKIHGAQVAMVVTTSHFTKAALDYCDRVGIRTCDREQLAGWASRTGPAPWQ